MPTPSARARFLELLRASIQEATLVKLTLGKPRAAEPTLRNVFVRPVTLKSGPHFAFVWRHATRDITKNFAPADAQAQVDALLGSTFLDGHLFTATQHIQFESQPDGTARIKISDAAPSTSPTSAGHDRTKQHPIAADTPWLRALGVTNDRGQPREGMADKFRQIQKFAELLSHLVAEAGLQASPTENKPAASAPSPAADVTGTQPVHVVDMGSGKGYLTFAIAALLGPRATVHGIEARPELVALGNKIAAQHGLAPQLRFSAGTIADAPLDRCEILIALHACDTATDDALARGISFGAPLLVVAPCCQKELRPQLTAPAVLADALRHGIFQERQAEFVTDALRAQLLEWAGYRTKVFEFISTEHTAKNLMIAAIKVRPPGRPDDPRATRLRELAAFYGIRSQRLAQHLGLSLLPERPFVPDLNS